MNKNYIWWEKTVEYKFILDAANLCKLDFAAPLAGVQERAGDAVFASDAKIFLVEFKRNMSELDSDKNKFNDYGAAEEALSADDGHHFLVYGELAKNKNGLACKAKTYFSRNNFDNSEMLSLELVTAGIEESAFKKYLEAFLGFKLADGRSSGGTISSDALNTVFGVSENGLESMSLKEYYKQAFPTPNPQKAQSNLPSPFSNLSRPPTPWK